MARPRPARETGAKPGPTVRRAVDAVTVDLGGPADHYHVWRSVGADDAGLHDVICGECGEVGRGYAQDGFPAADGELRARHAETVNARLLAEATHAAAAKADEADQIAARAEEARRAAADAQAALQALQNRSGT